MLASSDAHDNAWNFSISYIHWVSVQFVDCMRLNETVWGRESQVICAVGPYDP